MVTYPPVETQPHGVGTRVRLSLPPLHREENRRRSPTRWGPRCVSTVVAHFILLLVGCASPQLVSQATGPSGSHREIALRRVAQNKIRAFQTVAARLRTGIDSDLGWGQLDTLLSAPTGDMFWTYPATGFYFYCRDLLNDRWRTRFREAIGTYTPYRGDTENHFLMHYTFLLLFSQEWPELKGSEWFNGKSSAENYAEAKEYLNHWIDETVREGMTEWDSPRYLYFYITPLLILRDFTADATLRKRCDMMLEYMLADFAAEYLNGSYCGAHSRDGDGSVINPRTAEVTSYAQFYFEDSLKLVLPDLSYAAMSSFQCPEIIRCIAHDRDSAFVHTETKRSRAKMRFSNERYSSLKKYTYMTPDYALGSIPGGLQQPIQQHSWDVTFAADRPNNTLFGLHPQASAMELGMFFPEEPELMEQGILSSKASYGNENKWIGGSPYEQIIQYEDALIALYDIPPGTRFPHVDLFFPKSLDTIIRDTSGWIFCRMEDAFVGVYPIHQDYQWSEESVNWRLRINKLQTGYIVQCGSAKEMTFENFIVRLIMVPRPDVGQLEKGRYEYPIHLQSQYIGWTTCGSANSINVSDDSTRRICIMEGNHIANSHMTLSQWIDGPHLKSKYNSGILEMRCDGKRRTLDFVTNEVDE